MPEFLKSSTFWRAGAERAQLCDQARIDVGRRASSLCANRPEIEIA